MKKLTFSIVLVLVHISLRAQYAQFQSLELPTGALQAALGGKGVSNNKADLMWFQSNPALLDSMERTDLVFNYNPYFADISVLAAAYYADFGKLGPLAFGVNYLNYGSFDETDEYGNLTGSFKGKDYVISVGKSHRVSSFVLGANLKFAQTDIAGFGASMLAMDFGGSYVSPSGNFTAGLVFKNFGFRLNDFYADANTSDPFDVQLGITFKPEHAPFRLTMTGYNLVREDHLFREEDDLLPSTTAFVDRALRKINIGAEVILSKHVQLQVGYNHQRHQELKLEETGGGAGLSYGLMISTKKFTFRYARAKYHASAGANFISIGTNLRRFNKIL